MVVSGQNSSLTPTYGKRARQLVKKGRARWLDESTIYLLQPEEEYCMKNNAHEASADTPLLAEAENKQHESADAATQAQELAAQAQELAAQALELAARAGNQPTQAAAAASEQNLDEYLLRDLAQRRVTIRRSLVGQTFDFLLIVLFSLVMANLGYGGSAYGIAFLFCAFWGLRLIVRVYKYMRPSLKGGVTEYIRKRKEQQLEYEYGRLKKMSSEYVTSELNR